VHKGFRPLHAFLSLLLAALSMPGHAQGMRSLQDPGYRYYEIGAVGAHRAARTEPAMMLMGAASGCPPLSNGGWGAPAMAGW